VNLNISSCLSISVVLVQNMLSFSFIIRMLMLNKQFSDDALVAF